MRPELALADLAAYGEHHSRQAVHGCPLHLLIFSTPINNAVVAGYAAMWTETNLARRREVITASWDACCVASLFAVSGPDALDALCPGYTSGS